ncbi:OLC1v1000873C1 [Oldenlandia corymbosa var. corymbosa]|uniref:OLC1v1000873C1 n=2 Tax=Oldenlandia corymbosa var. corymbosa TaxID=529605 RepID=A0AAV1D6H0_OLDCO|nr:OLC1v1000873C1 [Oldenlandia corymbosa var. corymbosa]
MAESNWVLADEGIVDLDEIFTESEFFEYFGTEMVMSGSSSPKRFLVLWNQEDEELDSTFIRSRSPSTRIDNWMIKDKIRKALEHVDLASSLSILAQFWAPLIIADQCFLRTLYQPFGVTYLGKGLCSYRKKSSGFHYRCFSNSGESKIHLEDGSESIVLAGGPPSRVFISGFPEYSPDVEFYTDTEYPPRQYALHRKIKNYMAVPVFESDSQRCVGVVELVSTTGSGGEMDKPAYIFGLMSTALQGVGLRTSTFTSHFKMENHLAQSSMRRSNALRDIGVALQEVSISHGLQFAQAWTHMEFNGHTPYALSTASYGYYQSHPGFSIFRDTCESFHLTSGGGVVSKAFTCGGLCFCRDIGRLSIADYSFAHVARKVLLTASFAICLKSHHYESPENSLPNVYVLEFFLPSTAAENPRELLEHVLLTMKKHLNGFVIGSGENLESGINVQVLRVPEEDDNCQESFRLFPNISSTGGSVGLALDDQSSYMKLTQTTISVQQSGLEDSATGNAESNTVFNYSESLAEEASIDWEELFADYGAISTSVSFGCGEEHSSDTRSMKGTGSSLNNSIVSTSRFPDKDHGAADQDVFGGCPFVGPAIDYNAKVKFAELKETIEKHFDKKLKEAASSMKVSPSTLKRRCRDVGIPCWPRKKPNGGACAAATIEHSGKQNEKNKCDEDDSRQQCSAVCGGKETSTTTLSSKNYYNAPQAVARLPPRTFMTIKARYGKHIMIKFPLPFSSQLTHLELEVATRLKLEIGSFKLWYVDEDNEFILLTCDADLRTMESMGMSTIRACVTQGDSAPEWIH